jgi:hypothetical protein
MRENNKQFTKESNEQLLEVLSESLGIPKECIKTKIRYEIVEE